MNSWPMLIGLVFMLAIAGADAFLDHSSRRPFSWKEFRPDRDFWTKRKSKREQKTVAVAMTKEAR